MRNKALEELVTYPGSHCYMKEQRSQPGLVYTSWCCSWILPRVFAENSTSESLHPVSYLCHVFFWSILKEHSKNKCQSWQEKQTYFQQCNLEVGLKWCPGLRGVGEKICLPVTCLYQHCDTTFFFRTKSKPLSSATNSHTQRAPVDHSCSSAAAMALFPSPTFFPVELKLSTLLQVSLWHSQHCSWNC
jgi:hypothetical protein